MLLSCIDRLVNLRNKQAKQHLDIYLQGLVFRSISPFLA